MNAIAEGRRAQRGFLARLVDLFERGWFAPFLLSIQPVLQLFAINAGELEFSEIARSLIVSLLLGSALLSAAFFVLRDLCRASLLASLFLFLFFVFGDLAAWASRQFGLGPARANLVALGLVAMILAGWSWLVRRIRSVASVSLYFNLLAAAFLLTSLVQLGGALLENGLALRPGRSVQAARIESAGPRPDVYYIILDGYGRQDILQAFYELDNSRFVDDLAARGFYVANGASSNYIQTMLSLSSSSNMNYLQSLKAEGVTIENRADLVEILQNSEVRNVLAQNGYPLISFRNEYKATIPSAEIFYDDSQDEGFAYPVTAFESILIDRTMTRVLSHLPSFNRALIEMPYDMHRRHILFTFDRLQEIPAMDGDYFVYAHIIAPHPPFVFDEQGQAVTHSEPFTLRDANHYIKDHSRKDYIAGYRRQLQYINIQVLNVVDAILARSETPPIIVIQGDHGPGAYLHWGALEKTLPAERFGILNAYYFPDGDYSRLYPSISPVNSFRVVFNQFFDGEYALLPDQYYYSTWSFPFDFVEITDLSLP